MSAFKVIHVAVGVIINESQQVLIAQRHPNSHKGGLWEFPGGKKELGDGIVVVFASKDSKVGVAVGITN